MIYCNNTNSWYVLYTSPRSELIADKKLKRMGIVSYLPITTVVKQWSDRKKKIEVPLFPNYIFINCLPHERYSVLNIRELVKFVCFEGKPAKISGDIIDTLKKILSGRVEVSENNFYEEGAIVKVTEGQFVGSEGILMRKNGKSRLLIKLEALNTQLSVEIDEKDVEVVRQGCLALA